MTSVPKKTNRKSIGFKVGFVSQETTPGDILSGSYSEFYSKTIHPQSFDDFQNRTTILYLTKQEEEAENAKEERTATAKRIKAARLLDLIEILSSPLADEVFVQQFLHFYRTFTVYRITPNHHDPKVTLRPVELLYLLKLRFIGPHFFATPSIAKVWQEHKANIRANILSFVMLWIQKCYRSDFAENDFDLHNRAMITMHDLDKLCEDDLKDKSFGPMFEKIIEELERQRAIFPLVTDRLKLEQKPRSFSLTASASLNGANTSPSSTLRGSLDFGYTPGNSSPTRSRSMSLVDENDLPLPVGVDKTATLTRAEASKLTALKERLSISTSMSLKKSTDSHDRKLYSTLSMDDTELGSRDRSRTEDYSGSTLQPSKVPQRTKSGTGMKMSIDIIAKELCLIEHELFSRIQAKEYIKQVWTKKNKEQEAPHIMDVQTWFNQISMWISSEIVKSSTPQQRASIITKYIELANQLRQHNNFNGLMEVLVALNSSSISRLKLSWELVSSSMKEKFEELNSVMDPQGHFANYRACLGKAMKEGLPCVPFLGVCLSDFTFIDEGNSDTIDEDLVNFMKIRMMNHEYQRYVSCVSKFYQFESSEFTRTFLFGIELWNEQDLQKLSLIREPRKKSDDDDIRSSIQKRSLFRRKNTVRFLDCNIDELELDMTDRDWKLLLSCAVPIVFIKDQVIIDERTANTCMFKIKSGSVKVVKFADGGKERKVLKSLGEGAFFGEMSMLNVISGLTSASIIAETDTVELYTLERDLVETLFQSEPKLATKFFCYLGKILVDRFERTSSQITPALLKEVQELREKQHAQRESPPHSGTWNASIPLNQRKLKVRKKTFLNRRVAEEAEIETQIISDQLQEKLAAELDNSQSNEYNLSSLEYDRKELAKKVTIALAPHLVNENSLEAKLQENNNNQPKQTGQSMESQTDTYDDAVMSEKDKKLLKRFKLESDQIILKEYPCVLKQKVNVKAKLYLTRNYACVLAKPFGYKMKKRVVLKSVTAIEISLKLLIIRWDVDSKKVVLELPNEQDACEAEAFLKALWIWHKQTTNIIARSGTLRVSTIDQLRPTKATNKQVSSLTAAMIEQFAPNSSSKKKAEKEKKVLTDKDWEQLIGGTKSVSYQKGEVIMHGKSASKQRLYQIVSGTCRIESVVNGRTELIGALTAPDVFGVPSFFMDEDDEESDVGGTIIADTDDVSVIKIEGHFINVLISMYPELGARFYKYLSVVLARRIWERERLVFKY